MNKQLRCGLWLVGVLLLTLPSAASYSRRTEALQLYQEGLFQETGTGDLNLAKKIYQSILDNYSDYRDLAAVALYHLGLVHEKLGLHDQAKHYYQTILIQYVDQDLLVKKAQEKLEQRTLATGASPIRSAPHSRPATANTSLYQGSPSLGLSNTSSAWSAQLSDSAESYYPDQLTDSFLPMLLNTWGIGFNVLGVHASYGFSPNLQALAKIQWLDQRTMLGSRMIYYPASSLTLLRILPYLGLEWDWVQTSEKITGYYIGGFTGYCWFPWEVISLSLDIGYYYQKFYQGLGKDIDTNVWLNAMVTFYL